ncbi:MAG: hypothetical protein KDD39_01990 [Bdellovibrionales bacterium]|nr:hypothetical protein [Bdellovibrionales bacterium]
MPKSLTPVGVLQLEDWCSLRLSGSDIFDFLHRLSTLDFRTKAPPIRLGALLSGRAQLISSGFFEVVGDEVLYTLPESLAEESLLHLEKFHFAEAVTFSRAPASCVWIADASSAKTLLPLAESSWVTPAVPDLVWLRTSTRSEGWTEGLSHLAPLSRRVLHAHFLAVGSILLDLDQVRETLILEANLDSAVDRNKGCYPGQEVVERIFTYGNANKKLIPVSLDKEPSSIPCTLHYDNKEAGVLLACEMSEGRVGGLAMIHRNYWEKGPLKGDPDLVATIL